MTDEIYQSVVSGKYFRENSSDSKKEDEAEMKKFKGFYNKQ
jgi:hypothetical protein